MIKNANGKIVGDITYNNEFIIVNNYNKVNVVYIPKDIINNDNVFAILYDEYYLSIGEIAAVLNISYFAANKLFKSTILNTGRTENRRNRAYGKHVSLSQSEKMTAALLGRDSPTKGVEMSESTKRKISDSLSKSILNNPSKFNTSGFGYVGKFTSIKFNKTFTFRSLLELYYFIKFENDLNVIELESEPFRIQYSYNGKVRHYIPDLLINNKLLVEIKPEKYLVYRPDRFDEFKSKCKFAIKFAKDNGYVFQLMSDVEYDSYQFKMYLKNNMNIINKYSIVFNKSVNWLSD